MVEGYNNKQRKKAELIRQSVWAEKSSWEGSISYPDWSRRFFPLWFDDFIDEPIPTITDEQAAAIIERHRKYHRKIKEKKKKR